MKRLYRTKSIGRKVKHTNHNTFSSESESITPGVGHCGQYNDAEYQHNEHDHAVYIVNPDLVAVESVAQG